MASSPRKYTAESRTGCATCSCRARPLKSLAQIGWADNPSFTALIKVKDWIEFIRRLPQDAPDGLVFTEEEVEAILGGNAQRLFKL